MPRDKRAKFIELAEKRVNSAIKQLRLIGNLSDQSNYQFTEEDFKLIKNTLEAEMKLTFSRFDNALKRTDKKFTLSE